MPVPYLPSSRWRRQFQEHDDSWADMSCFPVWEHAAHVAGMHRLDDAVILIHCVAMFQSFGGKVYLKRARTLQIGGRRTAI